MSDKNFIDPTEFLEKMAAHYNKTRIDKYCGGRFEVSDVIEAFGCADGFTKGNVIKYWLRIVNKLKNGEKVPDTDYFKCVHYIAMSWNLEKENNKND